MSGDTMSGSVREGLEPCRECGASCLIECFPPSAMSPQHTDLWLCSQHHNFGGACSSNTAWFTEEGWNDRTSPPITKETGK